MVYFFVRKLEIHATTDPDRNITDTNQLEAFYKSYIVNSSPGMHC